MNQNNDLEITNMDVICTRCGEPWDVATVLDELPDDFVRTGCWVRACPCCVGRPPIEPGAEKSEWLRSVAALAQEMGDDFDGFVSKLADLAVDEDERGDPTRQKARCQPPSRAALQRKANTQQQDVKRTFTVAVSLTYRFIDLVQVTAGSIEESRQLAIEQAQCNWECAEQLAIHAMVVETSKG